MCRPDLRDLALAFARWAEGKNVRIYLFGSRVRGDHRPDSDVDAYVDLTLPNMDHDTVVWWTRQQETAFADLLPMLPGPLGDTGHAMLDPQDQATVSNIMNGRVVHTVRNVLCVWLPPKSVG